MPVDERGRMPDEPNEEQGAGEPAAVRLTEAPEGAGQPPAPLTPKGQRARWRRVVNRRNAMWTGLVAVVAVLALALVVFVLYRTGRIDRIIATQVVDTFSRYGIRAEIGSFETKLGPRTAELRDVRLYDAATGVQLGRIERVLATVRIEDMYALSLRRHVNLEAMEIDGLEVWVTFDDEGRSNFSNLRLPEPDPNSRILFAYSTADVRLNSGLIHYDDRLHDISGEAKNLRATVRPEDPNAPEESRMNLVELAFDDSTFVYDGKTVERISVSARARVNQTRAEIQELTLRSPVTEARLEGALDDWRALRYQMKVNATVDLTQTSDIFQPETTLRGTGAFAGTVSGEGDRYRVEGTITSDALAADGVRLKALNVSATGEGQGKTYEAQGRAVAELLTAGDFVLNSVQLAGGVTGTGADFRWIGELRAAAARSGQTSIAGLILSDAAAEMRGGEVAGTVGAARMTSVRQQDTLVSGVAAGGIRFRRADNGRVEATVANASAAAVRDQDTTATGARASGIVAAINPDESALVTVERVSLAGVSGAEFRTGSLNVAGVRLTVSPGGVVDGTTGDINVGTAYLGRGDDRAEGVRLARPRFHLEPSGRYRASADLSLGGGVLGKMRLGAVRGSLVATGEQIRLNDFVADIFNGRARGSAAIGTARGAQSSVAASFEGVDVGGLLASATGRVVPLTGAATGQVNLRFPGQNFRAASGTLDARFEGETGRDEAGRTPLRGELNVRADRGQFQIERANLTTGATELNASGRFSFAGDSDLALRLNSTDAAELQRVVVASGLAPELEETLAKSGIEMAGNLSFDGTLRGRAEAPLVNGRFALASLTMRGRDLGALSAAVESDDAATRITEGQLEERDGGGVRFTATIPRAGENNISLDATLENANAANLLAALGNPLSGGAAAGQTTPPSEGGALGASALAGLGPASGRLSVTGYPGAMAGSADLRVGGGTIGGEPYEEIAARATFSGSKVNLESLSARLAGGAVNASGTVDIESQDFDLRAKGDNVRLDLVSALFGGRVTRGRALPALAGIADFTATASGNLTDPRSYRVEVDARGRDVTVNGQATGELSLVGRTTPDNKFVLELTTGILGRPQVVRAEVNLASDALTTTVETTLAGVDLTQLFRTLLPDSNVRVEGRATGSLRATGNLFDEEGAFSLAGLQGRAEFSELVVQVEDVPLAAENPLVVLFSTNEVTFERTRFTGPGTNILFGGTAALREGGRQNLTVDGSLNLRVLNRISPNIFLSGAAQVGVRVAGTYADPRITGTAEVTGATFATLIEDERLQVTNINGRVRFNANQAEIETLTGRAGGGRVSVAGGALLAGFRPAQYSLTVRGDDVTVPFPNEFRTTADANLEIRGTTEGQLVRGTVNVRRTEYTEDIDLADLIDRRRDISLEEGGGAAALGQTTLDLQIEGRDALVVRNNLADMIGSVSLRVRGSVDDPVISGRITATRGALNFRNNRFEIQRAIIDLPPRRDADPVLNVVAEAEIRGYRVTATPSGPLSQLQVTLRSDPSLPQADVVSLITTGDLSSSDQSASVLGQSSVGATASLLTESLVNAPVRRATDKLFGLNRFEIDPLVSGRGGASPTARLTVGRQVNRDLSVTYSTNVTGEPQQVVAVEYRLSDRMSFVARYQQGSQNTLRTQNNDFSFEVRFRKRF